MTHGTSNNCIPHFSWRLDILTWWFADTVFRMRSRDIAADFMLSGFVETTKLRRDRLSASFLVPFCLLWNSTHLSAPISLAAASLFGEVEIAVTVFPIAFASRTCVSCTMDQKLRIYFFENIYIYIYLMYRYTGIFAYCNSGAQEGRFFFKYSNNVKF